MLRHAHSTAYLQEITGRKRFLSENFRMERNLVKIFRLVEIQ